MRRRWEKERRVFAGIATLVVLFTALALIIKLKESSAFPILLGIAIPALLITLMWIVVHYTLKHA